MVKTGLPSERISADYLSVSRITIRKAYNELANKGYVTRKQGATTMVAEKVTKHISNLTGFSEEMRNRGMKPGAVVMSSEILTPTEKEKQILHLNDGDKIIRIQRIRLANDEPIAIEVAVIPQSIIKSPDAIGISLYATLESIGKTPEKGIQKISAHVMNEEEATVLSAQKGDPMLVIERCCETFDGTPMELTITRYKASAFEFSTPLQK